MDIFKAPQNLVEEKLVVFVCQSLIRLDNLGEVTFHEICHHIQFVKTLQIFGQQDSFGSENVLVVQKSHNLELSQRS